VFNKEKDRALFIVRKRVIWPKKEPYLLTLREKKRKEPGPEKGKDAFILNVFCLM